MVAGERERGEVVGMEVMIDGKPMEEWVERVSSAFKNHLKRIQALEKWQGGRTCVPLKPETQTACRFEDKSHTCGECAHPWRKDEFGGQPDPEMLICFVRHNPNFRCRSRFDTACDKFEPRGE